MASLSAGTIVLLGIWTVWLVVGPWQLGRMPGMVLTGLFLPAALALVFTGNAVAWRPYVMAWLALHSVLVVAVAYAERYWWPRLAMAAVSVGGWLSLWPAAGRSERLFGLAMLVSAIGVAIGLVVPVRRRLLRLEPAVESAPRLVRLLAAASPGAQWYLDRVHKQMDVLRGEACQQAAAYDQMRDERKAELQEVVMRAQRIWRAQQDREARQTTSRAFCCTRCFSLWLVTSYPRRYEVRGPIGHGCDLCYGPVRFWLDDTEDFEPPGEHTAEAEPAGSDRSTVAEERVKFAADLLDPEREEVLAEHVAELLADPLWRRVHEASPADRCHGLSELADGLDELRTKIQQGVAKGVAFCAELVGAPDFLAELLGEVVGRAVTAKLEPLHTVAQGIRVVGAAACAVEGELDRCECAEGLSRYLARDVVKEVLTERIKEAEADVERRLDAERHQGQESARGDQMRVREPGRDQAAAKKERPVSRDLEIGD